MIKETFCLIIILIIKTAIPLYFNVLLLVLVRFVPFYNPSSSIVPSRMIIVADYYFKTTHSTTTITSHLHNLRFIFLFRKFKKNHNTTTT